MNCTSELNPRKYIATYDYGSDYSTRMPGLPIFYALLSYFSTEKIWIAVLKNIIISFITAYLMIYLYRLKKRNYKVWLPIFLIIIFSPPVIKHASAITYEEGILLELLVVYTFSLFCFIELITNYNKKDGYTAFIPLYISLTLITIGYLIKSSLIILLVITIFITIYYNLLQYKDKTVSDTIYSFICFNPNFFMVFTQLLT